MLKKRKLGEVGPEVTALGLGCMGMSHAYGTPDDDESIATIHRALDLGVDFLDTADVYGAGANETLVGKALRGRRDGVVLATKCGITHQASSKMSGLSGLDARPEYVREACDASLRRLGVDVIDLYYLHRVDPKTPIEDTIGAMAELVRAGKVRWLGLSEVGPEKLRRAHATHPIAALQSEYSLWERIHEESVIPTCRELGIAFVPFSPLGRGYLTGAIASPDDFAEKDFRRYTPRFQAANLERNRGIVDCVKAVAEVKGSTPAQVALAWVLAKGDDMIPIPGTKRREYLEENLGALEIPLDADDVARLDASAPPGETAGARYNETMASWVDH